MIIKTISQIQPWILCQILLKLNQLNTGRLQHHNRELAMPVLLTDLRPAWRDPELLADGSGSQKVEYATAFLVAIPDVDQDGRELGTGSWHFDRLEVPN